MDNSTYIDASEHSTCSNAASIFFATTMSVISLAAFIGNFLVIITVYKTPRLRTSTNYYYVNMAVSDFLASLTSWPLYLIEEMVARNGSLIQNPLTTIGCKVGSYFRMLSLTVSVLSLLLIAVDRFIATVFPLKATLINPRVKIALLSATWLISITQCILVFHASRLAEIGPQIIFCTVRWNSLPLMSFFMASVILYNFIPLILIVITYSFIMHTLKTRQQAQMSEASSTQRNRNKENQNVLKIFRSIVLAFFVCISLFGVYLILLATLHEIPSIDKCRFIRGFFHFVLPLLSTAINPIILFSFSTNFRNAMERLCHFSLGRCRSCCHVSVNQENISLPELVEYRQT